MKRALGAITDWDTFQKSTSGEYSLEDGGASVAASNAVKAGTAYRRASLLQTGGLSNTPTKGAQAVGNELPLDAHKGPHPSSDHASG